MSENVAPARSGAMDWTLQWADAEVRQKEIDEDTRFFIILSSFFHHSFMILSSFCFFWVGDSFGLHQPSPFFPSALYRSCTARASETV